jgi:hypothetical protein
MVRNGLGKCCAGLDVDELPLRLSGKELASSCKVGPAVAGVKGAAKESTADDGVVEAALVVLGSEQLLMQLEVGVEGLVAAGVLVDLASILCRKLFELWQAVYSFASTYLVVSRL